MPKNIIPSPAAAAAVDRLTLQATDARATDQGAALTDVVPASLGFGACSLSCFSEE